MSVFALGVVRREARLIIALVIVAAALLAVIHLGSEIGEDGTSGFDRWLILALRRPDELGQPIGPGWLRPIFVDITALGGVTALTLLTLTTIGYLVADSTLPNCGIGRRGDDHRQPRRRNPEVCFCARPTAAGTAFRRS